VRKSVRATERRNLETPLEVCKFGHSFGKCKCHLEVYRIGQDEAVFKVGAV
jgi:Ni,Fe-hydrogenase I large subunit